MCRVAPVSVSRHGRRRIGAIADQNHTSGPGGFVGFLAGAALPLLGVSLLAVAVYGILQRFPVPGEHLPFKPLDLERPIGLATGLQLANLKSDPNQCLAVLDASALKVRAIPERKTGEFCGFSNAVQILQSTVPYSGPVRVTCPLAAGLYLWEREIVAPAAETHLGGRVVRLDHLGTYSCRRIGGGTTGRPSEHATANAIDIAGFRLEDGRRVTVLGDWSKGSAAEQAFLREVRDGACDLFRVVLGPDYNSAHRDHFHFDMGRFGVCR